MVEIKRIIPGSPAEKAGLKAGMEIKEINGEKIRDYIDYLSLTTISPKLVVSIESKKTLPSGEKEQQEYLIEQEAGSRLGIELEGIVYDELKKCCNKCLFCFVDQQPDGVRAEQMIKDDDYRFSFLQGSFITLTNLTDNEYHRIISEQLSPLYISVHTTNPKLRAEMMGNSKAAKIKEDLELLASQGISFHLQLVIVPEYNDREELIKTLEDLSKLSDSVLSLGIVPVGLTAHREGLAELKSFTPRRAKKLIEQVRDWQQQNSSQLLAERIFLADEFFLLAQKPIPSENYYGEYPQLQNGIGLTRLTRANYYTKRKEFQSSAKISGDFVVLSSKLGAKAITPLIDDLNKTEGLNVEIKVIENKFLGEEVTVTGLLAGEDIISFIKKEELQADIFFLPAIIFNAEGKTLDGYHWKDIIEYFPDKNFMICESMEDVLEVFFNEKACSGNSRQA